MASGCHNKAQKGFGAFTAAGTLYAAVGGGTAVSQATIHLVDGAGKDVKLSTATNGNFFTDVPLVYPLTVKASKCPSPNQTMVGQVAASGASCNGCHASGSNQGRIHLP